MSRRVSVLLAVAGVGSALLAAPAARAASTPVVSVSSTSANLSTFQFVDSEHQDEGGAGGDGFLTFGATVNPTKESGPEGTAHAFVQQASTVETPDPSGKLPAKPLNDIALTGVSTSNATATGTGTGTVVDGDGQLDVGFNTDQPVPVFFSGVLHTANTDASDSCSSVRVQLTGPLTRDFVASTGTGCEKAGSSRHTGWAQSITLPAGDYVLSAKYGSALNDDVPPEASSMSASANISLDLAFMPPRASFRTTLSGSRATFDAGRSAQGMAGRPLTSYRWTFGDGTKKTTSTPTVSHTYAASPRTAPTYTVSLQVVDSGKAVSAPVTHKLLGTATTAAVTKHAHALGVAGAVAPRRGGHSVVVTLSRNRNGTFRVLATHRPTLSGTSHYATSFVRPVPGTCRVTARYAGDATHLASQRVATFAC